MPSHRASRRCVSCRHHRERAEPLEQPHVTRKRSKVSKRQLTATRSDGSTDETLPRKRRTKRAKTDKGDKGDKGAVEQDPPSVPMTNFKTYLAKVVELLHSNDTLDSNLLASFVDELAGKYGFSGDSEWVEGSVVLRFNKTVLAIMEKVQGNESHFSDIAREYLSS